MEYCARGGGLVIDASSMSYRHFFEIAKSSPAKRHPKLITLRCNRTYGELDGRYVFYYRTFGPQSLDVHTYPVVLGRPHRDLEAIESAEDISAFETVARLADASVMHLKIVSADPRDAENLHIEILRLLNNTKVTTSVIQRILDNKRFRDKVAAFDPAKSFAEAC